MLDTLELDPFVDPEVHKTMMSLDIYPPSIEFHIEYDPKSSSEPVTCQTRSLWNLRTSPVSFHFHFQYIQNYVS